MDNKQKTITGNENPQQQRLAAILISAKSSVNINLNFSACYFLVFMNTKEFKEALEGALKFYPGIEIKDEQKQCLESLAIDRKDVLGVLPTGYGKSLIYQLLPKLLSEFWFNKTGVRKIPVQC